MRFVETAANPLPPESELSAIRTADGLSLRAAFWERERGSADRGTLLLLQGRAEFIEKYFETVAELRSRGFAVATFDWRGQGGSDRLLADRHRGHVGAFEDFRSDYAAVRERLVDPRGGPVSVLAHSMGGCVALSAALDGWLGAERLVLSSPMVGLSLVRRPRLVRTLAAILDRLGLRQRLVPGGRVKSISTLPFEGNRLCTDRGRYERNAEIATVLDWGAIGSPTVGWLVAAYRAMDRLARPDAASAIAVPTLIVAGGDDPICSTPATAMFARSLPAGDLVIVPGARHEILMETDALRATFWQAFDAFMAGPDRHREAAESASSWVPTASC